MAEDRKQQSLDISITGSVDSSLARAIGVTEQQLAKLKDAVNTINKGFSAEAFKPAAQGMKDAEAAASSFHGTMQRIGETMAGVFSAELATKFFDAAIEGAKKLADFMKESGLKAATMEQMQTNLLTQLPKGTTSKRVEELTDALQYFSDKTPFRMEKVFDSFRELLVARVGVQGLDPKTGEYKSVDTDQVMQMIKYMGEIAAATTKPGESPSEHYAAIATAVQQSLLGGNLMERTLRPLEQMGLEIRPWLEQKYGLVKGSLGALGSDEDTAALHDLYKMIKKGEVPAVSIIDYLKSVAGPGGKYAGAIESHQGLAITAMSTLMDKIDTIMRGVGRIELGPFEDIINKINSSFTPEAFQKMQGFFRDAAEKSKAWMDEIMKAWDKVDVSGLTKSFQTLGDTLAKLFGQGATVDQWQKTLQALVNTLQALVNLTSAVVGAFENINKAIGAIDATMAKFNLRGPLTPEQEAAIKAKGAAGGHVDQAPNRGNYLNDADYQKAVARFNASPHMAAGGIVTRATSLVAGESGPEAILPLAALRDHPLVQVTKQETEQMQLLTEAMGRMTDTMATMQTTMSLGAGGSFAGGGGGGAPGFSGMSGGVYYTEYGPSVKGDQPGGPTYDSNSYNRIGAWPGITGKLQPGDVALGHGAEAFYHVRPGQTFVDSRGNTVRFADRSGSKNPMNEDVFRMAAGGIVRRATNAVIGEAGPEAVIPLNGGGLVNLHYSPTIHGFGDVAGLLREHADELLKQVEHALSSRFASMANV